MFGAHFCPILLSRIPVSAQVLSDHLPNCRITNLGLERNVLKAQDLQCHLAASIHRQTFIRIDPQKWRVNVFEVRSTIWRCYFFVSENSLWVRNRIWMNGVTSWQGTGMRLAYILDSGNHRRTCLFSCFYFEPFCEWWDFGICQSMDRLNGRSSPETHYFLLQIHRVRWIFSHHPIFAKVWVKRGPNDPSRGWAFTGLGWWTWWFMALAQRHIKDKLLQFVKWYCWYHLISSHALQIPFSVTSQRSLDLTFLLTPSGKLTVANWNITIFKNSKSTNSVGHGCWQSVSHNQVSDKSPTAPGTICRMKRWKTSSRPCARWRLKRGAFAFCVLRSEISAEQL